MLTAKGYDAYSLTGGYSEWLINHFKQEVHKASKPNDESIEKSIRKKFHKKLFSRFAKAINEYELIKEGDKIAVCISGGKDSMLMAKLFQELKKHNKFPFELVFMVMNPGYSETNRIIIEENAKLLNIPITMFKLVFLMRFLRLINRLAIYVPECGGDIYIINPGNWAAIRLLWDIIMMM